MPPNDTADGAIDERARRRIATDSTVERRIAVPHSPPSRLMSSGYSLAVSLAGAHRVSQYSDCETGGGLDAVWRNFAIVAEIRLVFFSHNVALFRKWTPGAK